MEKFWAVILIFAIVAAGGLLYVNQVYNPQKDSQAAMADMANQTLSAVKSEMENDTTSTLVNGGAVIQEVRDKCDSTGNNVTITVISDEVEEVYTNSSRNIEDHVGSTTKLFLRTPEYDNGELESIEFKEV